MSRLETLYLKTPTALQNLGCSAIGWYNKRLRFGGKFSQLLHESEARAGWSNEQLAEFRDRRLQRFVEHAATTVPYYQQLFRRLGLDPREVRTLDDLARLPILTKGEVQAQPEAFLSRAVPRRRRYAVHTSGTTGGGLNFFTTRAAIQEQWAACWRYRRWHGLTLGEWHAYFGGRSIVPSARRAAPYWRYNLPGRQILFSGFHMRAATLPAYLDELRDSRVRWLHGYPSLLALLAAYVVEHDRPLGYPLGWVSISSENLLPQQAQLIQRAFGVKPIQHYAMGEAVANASECPAGNLHVDEGFSAVEFLPADNGSGCRLLGTNLSNLAMPLLRYDVQDVAEPMPGPCPCGRGGRLIRRIDGRQEDYVLLPNGARLGRLDHIFKDLIHIHEAQIVQRRPDAVVLRVVRGALYSPDDEQRLLREARQRLGDEVAVAVEYVEALERTKIGKLRLVVSELPQGQLTGVGG